jgi:hypothetical protein
MRRQRGGSSNGMRWRTRLSKDLDCHSFIEWTARLGKPQPGWKWDILTGRGLRPSKRWLERPKCQAKKGAATSGRAWLILACLAVFQPLDFSPAGRIATHIQ